MKKKDKETTPTTYAKLKTEPIPVPEEKPPFKIELKWRPWCKTVAYIDMNIITMGLPVAIVNVVLGVNTTVSDKHGLACTRDDGDGWNKIACAIAVAVLISISDIGVWAARNLMNASEPGQDLQTALRMAGIWKLVSFFFMTFTFIGMICTQNFGTGTCIILWHSALLYIVSRYTRELKETISKLRDNNNEKENNKEKQKQRKQQFPAILY